MASVGNMTRKMPHDDSASYAKKRYRGIWHQVRQEEALKGGCKNFLRCDKGTGALTSQDHFFRLTAHDLLQIRFFYVQLYRREQKQKNLALSAYKLLTIRFLMLGWTERVDVDAFAHFPQSSSEFILTAAT